MIFHNCIKCDDFQMIPIADRYCFQKYECPECKTIQWIEHSRINPQTWSDEGFKEHYDIDGNTIKEKEKYIKQREELKDLADEIAEKFIKQKEEELLNLALYGNTFVTEEQKQTPQYIKIEEIFRGGVQINKLKL